MGNADFVTVVQARRYGSRIFRIIAVKSRRYGSRTFRQIGAEPPPMQRWKNDDPAAVAGGLRCLRQAVRGQDYRASVAPKQPFYNSDLFRTSRVCQRRQQLKSATACPGNAAMKPTCLKVASSAVGQFRVLRPLRQCFPPYGGSALSQLVVCRQNISDIWFGNLREYLAHLV